MISATTAPIATATVVVPTKYGASRLPTCAIVSERSPPAIPSTIEQLEDSSPPPEFGRPQWVRATAGFGGWVGGVIGGVGAIALLPIVEGMQLDVVRARMKQGQHNVERVTSMTVRRGRLIEVEQRDVSARGAR